MWLKNIFNARPPPHTHTPLAEGYATPPSTHTHAVEGYGVSALVWWFSPYVVSIINQVNFWSIPVVLPVPQISSHFTLLQGSLSDVPTQDFVTLQQELKSIPPPAAPAVEKARTPCTVSSPRSWNEEKVTTWMDSHGINRYAFHWEVPRSSGRGKGIGTSNWTMVT
jgi:hypothetical protein